MRCLLLALAIGACGNPPARAVESPAGGRGSATAPPSEVVIPIGGGANALLWDAATSTLFLTNNDKDTLLRWTDADGLQTVGAFPAASAGISLGGIVRRADGTTLVASFGFGTQGTLFAMTPGGASSALTGLDPARRRIGLAQDASGALYSAYFVGGGHKAPIGGVASVAIVGTTATETEIAGPFKKVVGLVATPTALFVADQTDKAIMRVAVPGYAVSPLASAPSVDLLMMMPNGDLLTGGGAAISRVTQAGAVTTLPGAPLEQVRGLAYDAARKRLFIVEHSATVGVPDKLHIRPLES